MNDEQRRVALFQGQPEGLVRMEYCDDPKRKIITEIRFCLTLPRGFPEKYRNGILRAMEQCTVKRHR